MLQVQADLRQVSMEKYVDSDAESLALMRNVLSKMHDLDSAALTKNLRNAIKIKQGLCDQILSQVRSNLERSIQTANIACQEHNIKWCSHINSMTDHAHYEFMKLNYGPDLELVDFIKTRTKFYSNWKDSALLWNIGDYENLDMFFGFYPIYIADKRMTTCRSVIESMVSPQQMRKIRTYDQDLALEFLPNSAFGLIISKNHFTHCSLDTMNRQISFLAKLLRNGGTLCFNFNDCQEVACAGAFENKIRSFILGNQVRSLLTKYNLEITHWEHLPKSLTTWVEAKLPGEYKSIKLGETMGILTQKPRR